ncbi:radical SAM protein [Tepiditoga spiralis]|uniref:Radical SAM protein n=1 Tax=Tepiditoga spiralis TaxID=2108365 RepID=A0A7G1G9Z3_9BACT|nr:radical SAM protein [Tepiditoga spiralis]BBE31843.1 radical SAM protein [Tepiditoga spiralis]
MKAIIIDGYVDEPAVLGVPPYISPYVRYAAGALRYHGIEVDYYTIDKIREKNLWQSFNSYEYLIIIAGTTVPGHYLGGTPINLNEIKKIFELNKEPLRVIGGPITKGYTITGGKKAISLKDFIEENVEYIVEGDIEKFLFDYPVSDEFDLNSKSSYELIDKIAPYGAGIIKMHERYPNVMLEIEVSKGCDRKTGFCSFCTEPILHGMYRERSLNGIINEMKALNANGATNFRFGRSANFLAYGITFNNGNPNPEIFNELYSEVSNFCNVLHTDNANPEFIVNNEKEAKKILEIISNKNTSGDILSFGIETFDDEVAKLNNIALNSEKALKAIRIVNEIGSKRDKNGIPKLLPGINLLYGLIGETKNTYNKNKEYLNKILNENLLLRRINVRQVMMFPGTLLSKKLNKIKINKKEFIKFKEFMDVYNNQMIKKVFPEGAILKDLFVEEVKGNISFSRQIATYPILAGIKKKKELLEKFDGIVVNHGSRSLTVLEYPFDFKNLSVEELSSINGIGKKTAEKIYLTKSLKDIKNEILKNKL